MHLVLIGLIGGCAANDSATGPAPEATPAPAPEATPAPAPEATPAAEAPPAAETKPVPEAKTPRDWARTRDAAYALALAAAERASEARPLALVDEAMGGGVGGPWVFVFAPPGKKTEPVATVKVDYLTGTPQLIESHPDGARAAVMAWELETYGSYQR